MFTNSREAFSLKYVFLALILSVAWMTPSLGQSAMAANANAKKANTAKADGKKKDAEKKDAEKKDGKKKDTQKKPATDKISLEGVFQGRTMAEIAIRAQEWNDFEVLKAVEHGTMVKPGDFLVAFDTEKIDRQIADLQRGQALTKLALEEANLQVQLLKSTVPMDLAASERAWRLAEEDYEQFLKVDRPLSERTANFMVKVSEDTLAYEKEELRQLEKMYKADDLVEETEEIVLRRARDSVERAEFSLAQAKTNRDTTLKLTLPRNEEQLKLNRHQREIDLQKAKTTIPNAQQRAELTLEKLKIEAKRSNERLQKLLADRAQMIVKSPVAGIVYYGHCTRGKWSSVESAAEKLRRGGRLSSDDIFMTIVEPRPLIFRMMVPEKQVSSIKPGMKGFVQPTGFPDAKLTAIVDRINPAPLGQNFDATATVVMDESSPPVVPGMTGELHLEPYHNPDVKEKGK